MLSCAARKQSLTSEEYCWWSTQVVQRQGKFSNWWGHIWIANGTFFHMFLKTSSFFTMQSDKLLILPFLVWGIRLGETNLFVYACDSQQEIHFMATRFMDIDNWSQWLFVCSGTCLVYDNSNAAPRNKVSWTKGRDLWWQVKFFLNLQLLTVSKSCWWPVTYLED